jgi:glycosyltransferase involved in cell wall biosynthesis
MRILLFNETARYQDGGGNRVALDTFQWLAAAGYETALAHLHGTADGLSHLQRFTALTSGVSSDVALWLNQVILEYKPDIIQTHSQQHLDTLLSCSLSVPVGVFLHDQSWFCSGGNRALRGYQPCHRPHGVACYFWHYAGGCGGKSPVGNFRRWQTTDRLQELIRHPRVQIQVASEFMINGLKENRFPSDSIDRIPLYGGSLSKHAIPVAPAALTSPDSSTESSLPINGRLFAPARLFHSKGLHVLLEAVAQLKTLPWTLVIAGKGPERERLEALSRRLQIADRVEFLGEIPPADMDGWYQKSQIIVFPVLRPEPFGLIGVEALAHGRPIVAFRGGAVSEWLWHGETGLQVDVRTSTALAQALHQLLIDPEQCRELGKNALNRYPFFHPDAYLQRLLTSFRGAVDNLPRAQKDPKL